VLDCRIAERLDQDRLGAANRMRGTALVRARLAQIHRMAVEADAA
jgi:hypothetical protein